MAGGGQLAAAAVRGIDTGLQIVDRLQTQERTQRNDALALEDAQRDLLGAMYLQSNGLPVTDDLKKKLGSRGIYPEKYQQPQMQGYLGAVQGVLSGDFGQKAAAIDGFNWRYKEQIGRLDGSAYDKDVTLPDGTKVPKGSTRLSTRVAGVYPSIGKDRKPDGRGVMLDLEVTVKTPDGRTVTYNAPATKKRSSEPDDEVLLIPMDRLTGNLHADEAYTYALNHPDARAQLEAEYVRRGGDPKKLRSGLEERKTMAEIGQIEAGTRAANARAAAAPVIAQAALERARKPAGGRAGGGAGSAQIQYAQFVADAKFGGSVTKALDWIKGGNINELSTTFAKTRIKSRDDARLRPGKEGYKTERIIQGAQQADPGAAVAAGQDAATPQPRDDTDEFDNLFTGAD